jgi:transcriptional regulator with XRE-family HTH domain
MGSGNPRGRQSDQGAGCRSARGTRFGDRCLLRVLLCDSVLYLIAPASTGAARFSLGRPREAVGCVAARQRVCGLGWRAMASVGDRVRARRLELGLSQRQLACTGVSYAHISRIEGNSRKASTRALRLLAPKLGVSVHWLETGKDDPAVQLAELVLAARGRVLPAKAVTLARRVVRESR